MPEKLTDEWPRGISGFDDLQPLHDLPEDAAQAGLNALLLAIGQGPRLNQDPYAVGKAANFDRLLFHKMPVICEGPRRILQVGKVSL